MIIRKHFGPYNSRRYSAPWGAVVTLDGVNLKFNFNRANFIGDADAGGDVLIDAEIGDVIVWGQKDYRNLKKSTKEYARLHEDGRVIYMFYNELTDYLVACTRKMETETEDADV